MQQPSSLQQSQQTHIPSNLGELPSSSVHLISPAPQHPPQKLMNSGLVYGYQVPNGRPQQPPQPQQYLGGVNQSQHQQQMQTSFQSNQSQSQQLLAQLQGQTQQQMGPGMGMVYPQHYAQQDYARQQMHQPYQNMVHQHQQPAMMAAPMHHPQQQHPAPSMQPIMQQPQLSQKPQQHSQQQQQQQQQQFKTIATKAVIARRPMKADDSASRLASGPASSSSSGLTKVVSRRDITLFNAQQSQLASSDQTSQDNNGVDPRKSQEEVQFKKTGDFGSQSQQPDNTPIEANPRTAATKKHYNTSPNRPPTFQSKRNEESNHKRGVGSENLQNKPSATGAPAANDGSDVDGTAAYQTTRNPQQQRKPPAHQSNDEESKRGAESSATTTSQAQISPLALRAQQVRRAAGEQQSSTFTGTTSTLAQATPASAAQTPTVAGMVRICLSHETPLNSMVQPTGASSSPTVQLSSIEVHVPQHSIAGLFEILAQVQKVPRQQVTVGMIEHLKDALWLMNKVIANKDQSLTSIIASNDAQTDLLVHLNQTLETYYASQPELVLACLRVLVTYLQKLDQEGHQLPIEQVKSSNLLAEGLKKCLLLDPIGAATSIHLTLKTLTQISFTCPSEIGKDLVTKVLAFCDSQEDSLAQENSIKLLCNLLTNERSCEVILSVAHDALNGIYQCLQSVSKSAVKFALGALLNLTLLQEEKREQSCEIILQTGGLSHLVCAVQKTYNSNDFESMLFGMKAFQNLVKYRPPLVKILTIDLGYLEIIFQLIRQIYQTVVKSTAQEVGKSDKARATKRRNDLLRLTMSASLGLLDQVAGSLGPNAAKESLIGEAGFLSFFNRMILLSVDKPADIYEETMVPLLAHLTVLCKSAWKFSKRIAEWEQEELASNVLSLIESTDSDRVLRHGIMVFIVMQESGLLLSDEVQNRLKEIHAQQNQSQLVALSPETKEALKRVFYLIHNTPFEKVSLAREDLPPLDMERLKEYKRAQQEAQALGSSFKLQQSSTGAANKTPSSLPYQQSTASPLKRRLGGGQEETTSTEYSLVNKSHLSEQASAYQLVTPTNASIPTKNSTSQNLGARSSRQASRQRGSIRQSDAISNSGRTQKLSKGALERLEYNNQNQMQQDSAAVKYGSIEKNSISNSERIVGDNPTHQQMLNRLETISLQESTRKGQSRALSLIAGSNAKTKPRGASSVAAIGGPLPPKIPPPTSVGGGGNFIPGGNGGSQSHRKQSQELHQSGRAGGDELLPKLNLNDNQSIAYQVQQSRSKSLIRGGGGNSQRPSGIGTGTGRLQLNQGHQSRQQTFEEHVERFNQLEPLLKGQTIDYTNSGSSTVDRLYEIKHKAHSTIQHPKGKAAGSEQPSAAYNAIGAVVDSRLRLAKGGGFASPRGIISDTQAFVNQPVHEVQSSPRFQPHAPDLLESSSDRQVNGLQANNQAPWQQAMSYNRADSRGSELAVHLQNFGLKNSPTNSSQPARRAQGPAMMIQESSQQSSLLGYDDGDAPPIVEEEYQQPTYESYYAKQNQSQQSPSFGQQSNITPINPFPSMDASHLSQQNIQIGNKHKPTLASVSEEQEDQYIAAQMSTQMVAPPQPVLQPKQNFRPAYASIATQQQHQNSSLQIQQQTQPQLNAPPRTIDEMVKQNQRIIAEKAQRGQQHSVAATGATQTDSQQTATQAQLVNPADFSGQEQDLVKKYPDVNLMDKDSLDSRQARFQMGIGMPEARALLKRTNGGSFRQQVEWFAETCANQGQNQAFSEVKQAVCSVQNTQKLVSLYVLAAHQLGFPMGDYFKS